MSAHLHVGFVSGWGPPQQGQVSSLVPNNRWNQFPVVIPATLAAADSSAQNEVFGVAVSPLNKHGQPMTAAELTRELVEQSCPQAWLLPILARAGAGAAGVSVVRLSYGGGYSTTVLLNGASPRKDPVSIGVGLTLVTSNAESPSQSPTILPRNVAYDHVSFRLSRAPDAMLYIVPGTRVWEDIVGIDTAPDSKRTIRVWSTPDNVLHLMEKVEESSVVPAVASMPTPALAPPSKGGPTVIQTAPKSARKTVFDFTRKELDQLAKAYRKDHPDEFKKPAGKAKKAPAATATKDGDKKPAAKEKGKDKKEAEDSKDEDAEAAKKTASKDAAPAEEKPASEPQEAEDAAKKPEEEAEAESDPSKQEEEDTAAASKESAPTEEEKPAGESQEVEGVAKMPEAAQETEVKSKSSDQKRETIAADDDVSQASKSKKKRKKKSSANEDGEEEKKKKARRSSSRKKKDDDEESAKKKTSKSSSRKKKDKEEESASKKTRKSPRRKKGDEEGETATRKSPRRK